MLTLFSNNAGMVFRYDEPVAPVDIELEGFGPALNAAMTSLGVSGQANAQFSHMLKNLIYVYVFGERLGDMQISGAMFPRRCGDAALQHGHVYMQKYYDAYGLSARGKPVKVSIGTMTYEGFLIGYRLDTNDPTAAVGAFTLLFKKSARRPVDVGEDPVVFPDFDPFFDEDDGPQPLPVEPPKLLVKGPPLADQPPPNPPPLGNKLDFTNEMAAIP